MIIFKMRLIHPLSLSSSSSSLHSQYRNFRFHFFFLFHTFSGRYFSLFHHVHFNSSLYGNSKIHYPSHVLKIPSSLLHEMTSFLNFVQFLSTMQLPFGKKKYKNEMKEAFLLISWQISIANFTAVVSSVGFDHQYTVFTAFSLLPFPSSLQLHSWCVFFLNCSVLWRVVRRIKNY